MSNRPEPDSSPGSAKAPLVSNPDGPHDHRGFTKGVNSVTRTTVGKDAGTAKSPRKKVERKKVKRIGATKGKK